MHESAHQQQAGHEILGIPDVGIEIYIYIYIYIYIFINFKGMLDRVGDISSDDPNLLVDVPAAHLGKPILKDLLEGGNCDPTWPP